MKEENRIQLADMRNRLQERMNYPHPNDAFRVLMIGFAHYKNYSTGWVGSQFKRGSLHPSVAAEFAKYVGYPSHRN